MTTPRRSAPAPSAASRLLRPRVFIPALLVLILLSVLATPHTPAADTGMRLTSYSTGPGGARGFADVAERLGWSVERLEAPITDSLSEHAIYAVLVPADALTAAETGALLDRVRAGAGLLVILGGGALRDSLHLDVATRSGRFVVARGDTASCPEEPRGLARIATAFPPVMRTVEFTGPPPGDTVHLARTGRYVDEDGAAPVAARDTMPGATDGDTATSAADSVVRARPAAIGMTLGQGRIVAVADPQLLANDVLRVCKWQIGVTAVGFLRWLSERDGGVPPRTRLVFDEYHHGYGPHASVTRTIARWMERTPSGRTAAQLAVAGLILLVATAPRAVPPLARTRIARRSALEHVAALADAYEQTRASRTAVRLLVQGVRRRVTRRSGGRRVTDAEFLRGIAHKHPPLAADAERVREAMTRRVTPAELLDLTRAIDRIDRSLH